MRTTRIISYLNTLLFTGSVLLTASCNLGKKDGDQKADNDARPEESSKRFEKNAATKSSGTFEEFVMKKNAIELQIYSTRVNEIFDMDEAVELRVNLHSPRFLTIQTYQNSLGKGQQKPEIDDLLVGSEEQPWHKNLNLFYLKDDKEIPVSFAVNYPSTQNMLNIGQGEIGSMGILLQPGALSFEGNMQLRLKYAEAEKDLELMAETSIILKKDYADELLKKISMIYYLIATGKKQEALNQSLESVQAWPDSYHATVLLGEIYEENGQLNEALATFRKGIVLYKDDREDRITEYPKGLWKKINELETKLEK